jgi:hypothetical protein
MNSRVQHKFDVSRVAEGKFLKRKNIEHLSPGLSEVKVGTAGYKTRYNEKYYW